MNRASTDAAVRTSEQVLVGVVDDLSEVVIASNTFLKTVSSASLAASEAGVGQPAEAGIGSSQVELTVEADANRIEIMDKNVDETNDDEDVDDMDAEFLDGMDEDGGIDEERLPDGSLVSVRAAVIECSSY